MRCKFFASLLISLTCGSALGADAQTKDPLEAMEAIANKFEVFFATKPVLLFRHINQTYSPTGESYQFLQYRAKSISYDVVKTDSLVSPYSAHISVDAENPPMASPCSSMRIGNVIAGWPSSVEALKHKDRPECFPYATAKYEPDPLRFNFAFQKNTWVLKSIVRTETGMPENLLSAAMIGTSQENSRPVEDENGRQFNAPWAALVR